MASGAAFEAMMKNSTPEQRQKGMDAWMKWMNANKASIVEGGAPLGKIDKKTMNQIATLRQGHHLVDEFDYAKFDVAGRYLA